VSSFRKKYEDVLLEGVYREQEGIHNNNTQILCALFEGETRSAIALWNDTSNAQPVDLHMTGRKIVSWETVDGSGEGMLKLLKPGAVAILLLE
jgi:hypothetical protein